MALVAAAGRDLGGDDDLTVGGGSMRVIALDEPARRLDRPRIGIGHVDHPPTPLLWLIDRRTPRRPTAGLAFVLGAALEHFRARLLLGPALGVELVHQLADP